MTETWCASEGCGNPPRWVVGRRTGAKKRACGKHLASVVASFGAPVAVIPLDRDGRVMRGDED